MYHTNVTSYKANRMRDTQRERELERAHREHHEHMAKHFEQTADAIQKILDTEIDLTIDARESGVQEVYNLRAKALEARMFACRPTDPHTKA